MVFNYAIHRICSGDLYLWCEALFLEVEDPASVDTPLLPQPHSSFSNFWMNLIFIQIFGKFLSCSKCMDLFEPVKLFPAWNRDTG